MAEISKIWWFFRNKGNFNPTQLLNSLRSLNKWISVEFQQKKKKKIAWTVVRFADFSVNFLTINSTLCPEGTWDTWAKNLMDFHMLFDLLISRTFDHLECLHSTYSLDFQTSSRIVWKLPKVVSFKTSKKLHVYTCKI